MMVLIYEDDSVRIIVSTANLVICFLVDFTLGKIVDGK